VALLVAGVILALAFIHFFFVSVRDAKASHGMLQNGVIGGDAEVGSLAAEDDMEGDSKTSAAMSELKEEGDSSTEDTSSTYTGYDILGAVSTGTRYARGLYRSVSGRLYGSSEQLL